MKRRRPKIWDARVKPEAAPPLRAMIGRRVELAFHARGNWLFLLFEGEGDRALMIQPLAGPPAKGVAAVLLIEAGTMAPAEAEEIRAQRPPESPVTQELIGRTLTGVEPPGNLLVFDDAVALRAHAKGFDLLRRE